MKEDKVTIKIPRPLYRRIKVLIEGSGFDSPTDFVVYVLRDLVGGQLGGAEAEEPRDLSQDEIHAVRRRLKNLGYL